MKGESQTERLERREAELRRVRQDLGLARALAHDRRQRSLPFLLVMVTLLVWVVSAGEVALNTSLGTTLVYVFGSALAFSLGLGMPRS